MRAHEMQEADAGKRRLRWLVSLCFYSTDTFSAHGPLGPWPSVYDTRWPSLSSSKLTPLSLDEWKNRSLAFPVLMKPKPLSVSFLIVPSDISSPNKKVFVQHGPTQFARATPMHKSTV